MDSWKKSSITRLISQARMSPAFHRLALVTIAVLLMFCTSAVMAEETCTFTSRTYSVGDVFYPRLGQRGALHCVACVCQEGGKINCTIHQCDDCQSAHTTNECCVYCSRDNKHPALGASSVTVNRPVTNAKDANVSSEAIASDAATTCLHNGVSYRHKERFTSTNIGLKPERPNQCVQCACETGMVLCQLIDCPKPECQDPIRTREDCCPVCPDPAGRVDEMDNSPVIIQQPDVKMHDCISGGKYYLHGTSWHPVMGPFGPMDCVTCNCISGRIECKRLDCPNQLALNCENPIKVAGRCCPVCSLDSDSQGEVSTTTWSSEKVATMTKNTFKTTSVLNRTPAQAKVTNSASHCLPNDHDTIVFRAQGGGNASEFIQYIFQKIANGTGIEHHLWMLQTAVTTYKVQDLTKDQAHALRQRFRFTILGSTMTKNVKKFTKREKKLKPKCLPASGCPKKIRRLERNLALKEVPNHKGCLPAELETL